MNKFISVVVMLAGFVCLPVTAEAYADVSSRYERNQDERPSDVSALNPVFEDRVRDAVSHMQELQDIRPDGQEKTGYSADLILY